VARYFAIVDYNPDGEVGVSVPDIPGLVAMGSTVSDALSKLEDAWVDVKELSPPEREFNSPSTMMQLYAMPDVNESLNEGGQIITVELDDARLV